MALDPSWINAASSVIGGALKTSTPAGPSMAATNPVYAGMFDSSGWSMNFSGTQTATSSPANSVSPVTTAPGQTVQGTPLIGGAGGGDNSLLLIAAGVALLMVLR